MRRLVSDENVHRVRTLLDETFGDRNFCSVIKFFKTTSQTSKYLPQTMDALLWYAKDKERMKWHPMFLEKEPTGEGQVAYDWVEFNGFRKPLTSADRTQVQALLDQGWLLCALDNLTSQSGGPTTQFTYGFSGSKFAPATGGWKTNLEGMKRLHQAGRLAIKGSRLRYVRYINDFPVTPLSDAWADVAIGGFVSEEKRYVVQTSPKVPA